MIARNVPLLLVVLSGCGGGHADVDPNAGGTPCPERIALFDARLGIAAEVRATAPPDGLDIPRVDTVPSRETRGLPIVEVRANGLRLDDRAVDEARLAEDLAILQRNWDVLHPGIEYREAVALWADAGLSVSRLTELAAGALAGYRVFVMAQARTHPHASELPRCPASIGARCAALASSEPYERATTLSEIHTRAVRACAPAIRAFAAIPNARLHERMTTLRRGLVAAARECGCDELDLDALEYGILLGEDALAPPSGGFPLPTALRPEEASLTVQAWVDAQ